jgi:pyruvate dehydrogenase (quinone)
MAKTAADQIAEMMIDAGIQRVYGLVGDSINPIIDAIRRTGGKLRFVACRNEEVGAFAAGADALLTGQIAACAGSCGPGNMHLIQGLYNSHRNRAPVFAIAGQVPTRFLGTEYFQETHPERIFRDCSHYCEAAYTAVQAATMSRMAIQSAITKRGVGLVCIPGDTMAQSAAVDLPAHPFSTDPPRIRPTDDDLDKLAQIIDSARRPLIFGGDGCRGGREQVLALSQKINAPIGYGMPNPGNDRRFATQPSGSLRTSAASRNEPSGCSGSLGRQCQDGPAPIEPRLAILVRAIAGPRPSAIGEWRKTCSGTFDP